MPTGLHRAILLPGKAQQASEQLLARKLTIYDRAQERVTYERSR